jgi:alkanesulfonate monooxygenase SsuD/methylene tetrahydromethanopterin reductase-like flavin-dependent oxidoreductase (luciferase family)
MRFGACFWMQRTGWSELAEAWRAAADAGFDSLWTEDHLFADVGDWRWPKFEGYAALAALAPTTPRPTVGLMVTAVMFRNPGHVAKLATTLDHITGGRFVLGMGAGHLQREHEAFGFDFGVTPGARLDRLDEATGLIRRLLDGETVTHHGRYYDFVDAVCEPRPVQAHLPIWVGGNGPNKTMRIVAKHADGWNGGGRPPQIAETLTALRERCAEVGRDYDSIHKTALAWAYIRDRVEDANDAARKVRVDNEMPLPMADDGTPINPFLAGPPSRVADAIRAYEAVGIQEVLWHFMAPFDMETIRRLPEVRAALA